VASVGRSVEATSFGRDDSCSDRRGDVGSAILGRLVVRVVVATVLVARRTRAPRTADRLARSDSICRATG
jgi:hypothetical protein